MENEESLKTGTLVSQFSDAVQDEIDDFFTDGVMTSGVVVSGIFFTGNKLFRVEKLTVGTGSDLKIMLSVFYFVLKRHNCTQILLA